MVIHWSTFMKNVAQFNADTADFLGGQNHSPGQLHKQKMSQDIRHPSSLNFEWGRAFFFFLPEVSTFVRCTNELWSADEVLKHLWHNEYVWQTCWSCFEQGGKNVDKINITEVATMTENRKPVLTHRLLGWVRGLLRSWRGMGCCAGTWCSPCRG